MKVCLGCNNESMTDDGVCTTDECMFNPEWEMKEFDYNETRDFDDIHYDDAEAEERGYMGHGEGHSEDIDGGPQGIAYMDSEGEGDGEGEGEGQGDGDEDDGLPPRPEGCEGDCGPSENEDDPPCPHCTAKQFRDEMMEQENEKDDENKQGKEKKYMARNMSNTEEDRYDSIAKRIRKKVEEIFGKTIDDFHEGPKKQGELFLGEDVTKTFTIQSNNVNYFVTVSASKIPSELKDKKNKK